MVKKAEMYLELVVELHDMVARANPLEENLSSKYNLYLYNEANKQWTWAMPRIKQIIECLKAQNMSWEKTTNKTIKN